MLSRNIFHMFRPLSTDATAALKVSLTKILEEEILQKPFVWESGFLVYKATLSDGVIANVFPGVESENTIVSVSKNGVTVERELDEWWPKGWSVAPNNTNKNTVPLSKPSK